MKPLESTIKISVIIPAHNSEKYLRNCLDSVVKQTFHNWNVYVIDDASSDQSLSILREYENLDQRFKVYSHTTNRGPGVTRNIALQYAIRDSFLVKSEIHYVVYIDSDDWIETDYFEQLANTAVREKPDVIFIDVVQETESGEFIKTERISRYKKKQKNEIIKHQLTGKLPWGGVRKAVLLELLQKHNIYFSDIAIGEEALYSFKLLYHAGKISFLEKTMYHYIQHRDSQSASFDDNPYGGICIELKKLLLSMNIYNEYRKPLNSFAFTALIVSIYRKTQYYGMKKAIHLSKAELREFRNNFGFQLDKDSLEVRTRFLLPLAKLNLINVLVLISKLKEIVGKNRNFIWLRRKKM